ncbi:MAG: glycosyltransferase [Kiritimatiellia bacterium]|jgi:glycosyltransferase involved in cell wall biosynthesis|nr:glycosyltransferase [Kiritimatiellia bacterium]MDP6847897.1 glycosyltransferase [Kiritimatiellia bacterium]
MRILFIDHGQYITVAVPKLIEMAETLVAQGHSVEIALTHRTNRFRAERFEKNGVVYHAFPSLMWGKLRHGACPWDMLRRTLFYGSHFDFDIIHARDSRPNVIFPALYLRKRFKVPVVLEWADLFSGGGTISERSGRLYSHTLGAVETFFEKGFRLKADGAAVVSSFLRDELLKMGFPSDRILISRNGGIMSEGHLVSKEDARKMVGWDSELVYALFLGRIFPRDLKLLTEAIATAAESHPELKVVMAGDIPENERINHPNLCYEGRVPDDRLQNIGRAVDFCVLPMKLSLANRARWPSKIGSYFSFGKPVLSTPVSDFSEIYREADVGILCNDTVEAFADGLCRMVESQDRWEEWGKNTFDYGRRNLDWPIIMDNLVTFYEKVLQHATK